MRRAFSLLVAALAAACATSSPDVPHETRFAAELVARAETAEPAPRPESPAPTAAVPVPPRRSEGEVTRGLLVVPGKLRAVAADEQALAEFLAESISRQDLAALAYLRSPKVLAARARIEAARTGYRQSADLADLLSLYRSWTTREGRALGTLPRAPNVSTLSAEVVGATVEIAFEGLRTTVLGVVAEAERVHADAARLSAARLIMAEDVRLSEGLVRVLRARLEAGGGTQAGYLAFSAHLETLRTELAVLEEQRAAVLARLNSLLDRPVRTPASLDLEFAEVLPARPDLLERALDEHPRLKAARLRVTRGRAAVRMAETMMLPPRPDYGVREAQVAEMRNRLAALEAEASAAADTVGREVGAALFGLEAARRRVESKELEVVPLADRAFLAARGAYEGRQSGYLSVLQAARRRLEARLGLADSKRMLAHARADLLVAAGLAGE